MDYRIDFQKSPVHPIEHDYQTEHHLAIDTAEAVILEGYRLVGIQPEAGSLPLTAKKIFERRDIKAAYCEAYGEDHYKREETFVVERFRAAHR